METITPSRTSAPAGILTHNPSGSERERGLQMDEQVSGEPLRFFCSLLWTEDLDHQVLRNDEKRSDLV